MEEHLIEGSELSEEGWVAACPFVVVELVGQEFHFDESFALGVEVSSGIASEVFDLVVEPFGQIGGA